MFSAKTGSTDNFYKPNKQNDEYGDKGVLTITTWSHLVNKTWFTFRILSVIGSKIAKYPLQLVEY